MRKIYLYYLAGLFPVLVFFGILLKFAVNIPFHDDFDAVLAFFNNFISAESLSEKIKLLFSQHNEHRIIFNKLFTIASYYITGEINFKFLILFGNFALVGVAGVIFSSFRQEENKILYFLPVMFLLFQFQSYENSLWGMASIQNFYVLLFAFLALFFLSKESFASYCAAIAFAIAATFTSGNGMFCFITGLMVLLYKKQYKYALLWGLLMISAISIYFYGYVKPGHHPSIYDAIFVNPFQTMGYFFAFAGSLFGFSLILGILAGITFIFCFFLLISKKYQDRNPANFSYLLFLFMTTAAVSLSRSGFGMEQALSSRYAINSTLILIFLYVSFIEIKDKKDFKNIFIGILSFSVIFNIYVFFRNQNIIKANRSRLLGSICEGKVLANLYPDIDRANSIFTNAVKGKYFYPPADQCKTIHTISSRKEMPVATNNLTFAFEIKDGGSLITIKNGWVFINGMDTDDNKISLVLKSDERNYFITTILEDRPDVTAHFNNNFNLDNSGFSVFVSKDKIEKGSYRIGFSIQKDDVMEALQFSDRTINIP
jgi:hypothetical protein